MKKPSDHRIQDQVNKTLDSFNSDVPPTMDPWFYERLTNRIKQESSGADSAQEPWFIQALKPGMMAGLVVLNILIMFWTFSSAEIVSSARMTNIENLSTQYGLNYSDTYLLSDGENQ
ncbi:hypothetical protein HQ531_00210 [bacterium]|nr:hypothetical protein [bacterium]